MKRPVCLPAVFAASLFGALVGPLPFACAAVRHAARRATELRFEVELTTARRAGAQGGRVYVVLGRLGDPEPRLKIGETGLQSPPVLGRDVGKSGSGPVVALDRHCALFPLASLAKLPRGEYRVQALWHVNRDLNFPNAPGNFYSAARKVRLDPSAGGTVRLYLTQRIPGEKLPPNTDYVRYEKFRSEKLSRFHGRPIYLRVGVVLPRDHAREPRQQYPVWVRIGGYGSRFDNVKDLMSSGSDFRKVWLADGTPRMILLQLDGAGPFGDPYQVNSANNGPYGDAVTQELIPYVERKYRGIGKPYARVVEGGSTGGWVSLALQVFYPDFFNGCWSGFPDGVDFRAFQLIDIYADRNAYVNRWGFERPSKRTLDGDVEFTMRHECQMENVMGRGDSYTLSGGQWGAWNAVYGPRGANGLPVPIWDPKTGEIRSDVAEQWKRYDLRLLLEKNWHTLGPKLRGKIRVWVGEADDYFLNNGVHRLYDFLVKAKPPFEGRIVFGPRQRHGWTPQSMPAMMQEMAAAIERGRAKEEKTR